MMRDMLIIILILPIEPREDTSTTIGLHRMVEENRTIERIIESLRMGIIGTNHCMTRENTEDHLKSIMIRGDPPMNIGIIGYHPMNNMAHEKGARPKNMVMVKEEDHNREITARMSAAQYPPIIIMPR